MTDTLTQTPGDTAYGPPGDTAYDRQTGALPADEALRGA